jgi:hypothetical protein
MRINQCDCTQQVIEFKTEVARVISVNALATSTHCVMQCKCVRNN